MNRYWPGWSAGTWRLAVKTQVWILRETGATWRWLLLPWWVIADVLALHRTSAEWAQEDRNA